MTFKDRKGQLWHRRIDVDAAVRMRSIVGLDVMEYAVPKTAESSDTAEDAAVSLIGGLFALFLPDAQLRGVTGSRFGKLVKGLDMEHLQACFIESVDDFFHQPGPTPEPSAKEREITAEILWQDIYRLAGEACVSPGPHTYGELAVMADGRRRSEWAQTAMLRADVINLNPFRSGPAVNPADLDPSGGLKELGHGNSKQMEVTPDDMWLFGKLFVGKG